MTDEQQYFEKLEAVIDSEGDEAPAKEDVFITLTNGVVLEVRGISPFLFRQVEKRFPDPPIPKVFLEDKGREEENPQNPEYLRRLAVVEADRAEALIDLIVGYGTNVVSFPTAFPSPDSDLWIDGLVGLLADDEIDRIRNHKHLRHLAWIKFVAIATQQDIQHIAEKVYRKLGVGSQDVSDALANFRRDTERNTDS